MKWIHFLTRNAKLRNICNTVAIHQVSGRRAVHGSVYYSTTVRMYMRTKRLRRYTISIMYKSLLSATFATLAGAKCPRLSIVSFNGCWSELLLADYTGALWYLLRLSYKSYVKTQHFDCINSLSIKKWSINLLDKVLTKYYM